MKRMLWFSFVGLVSLSLIGILLYRLFRAKPPRDFKIEAGLPLDSILPYRNEQGLWGFRHRNGQILTEAKYQGTWLQPQISPVFWILNDGLWFALDAQGNCLNEQGYPVMLMYPAEDGRPAYLLGFDEGVHLLNPQGQSYFKRFLGRGYNDIKVFSNYLLTSQDYGRGKKGGYRADIWYQIYDHQGNLLDKKEYFRVFKATQLDDSLRLLVATKRDGKLSLWKQGQKPSAGLFDESSLTHAYHTGNHWLIYRNGSNPNLLYNDQGQILHQSQNLQEKIHLHPDFALVEQGKTWLYFGPNKVELNQVQNKHKIQGISLDQGQTVYLFNLPKFPFLNKKPLKRPIFEQIKTLIPKQELAILQNQDQEQLYDLKNQVFLVENAQEIHAIEPNEETFLIESLQKKQLHQGFLIRKENTWHYYQVKDNQWIALKQIQNLGEIISLSNPLEDYLLLQTKTEQHLYRLSDAFHLQINNLSLVQVLNPQEKIFSCEENGHQTLFQIQGLNSKTLSPLPKLNGKIEFVWPSGLILLSQDQSQHSLHNLQGQVLAKLGLTSIFARDIDPLRGLVVPYGENSGVYNHQGQKIKFEGELVSPHLCFGNLICEGQSGELREAYLGREIFDWSGRRWPN